MGEVIQLQGDQRKDVQEFLVDKKEGLELDAKTIKVCFRRHSTLKRKKTNKLRSMGSKPQATSVPVPPSSLSSSRGSIEVWPLFPFDDSLDFVTGTDQSHTVNRTSCLPILPALCTIPRGGTAVEKRCYECGFLEDKVVGAPQRKWPFLTGICGTEWRELRRSGIPMVR